LGCVRSSSSYDNWRTQDQRNAWRNLSASINNEWIPIHLRAVWHLKFQ
jgi:hypothetical protein